MSVDILFNGNQGYTQQHIAILDEICSAMYGGDPSKVLTY